MRQRIGRLDRDTRDCCWPPRVPPTPRSICSPGSPATPSNACRVARGGEGQGHHRHRRRRVRFAHPLVGTKRLHRREARAAPGNAPGSVRTVCCPNWGQAHGAGGLECGPDDLEGARRGRRRGTRRGAPAAAAELVELAIGLGGDTPSRRIRAAEHHFQAGDRPQAARCWSGLIDSVTARAACGPRAELLAGMLNHNGSFEEAVALLERALDDAEDNPAVLVQTLLLLTFAQGSMPASSRNPCKTPAGRVPRGGDRLSPLTVRRSPCGQRVVACTATGSTRTACGAQWNWKIPTETLQSPSPPAPFMP